MTSLLLRLAASLGCILIWFLLCLGLIGCHSRAQDVHVQDGDVVFQTSQSSQSQAIQIATKSRHSHMGVVLFKEGEPFVFEAIEPVCYTPLDDWIARGAKGHAVIKRLVDAERLFTPVAVNRMRKLAASFEGKHYDRAFSWDDSKMYCSEIVWKLFDRALGIQVGKLQKMKEFDLSSPPVKAKIKERYGNKIPLEEKVISPQAMYESDLLETVQTIN